MTEYPARPWCLRFKYSDGYGGVFAHKTFADACRQAAGEWPRRTVRVRIWKVRYMNPGER